ncbi:ArsR/SmtB family transcription factor [Egicoccus sp. AB-alg6-2]|uniref:ArsR/SmtB family transcription factor n=1 Tax=Egicoccus sp. AB-alg6-2 TaxID=3242692 RepID=UPI00359E811D
MDANTFAALGEPSRLQMVGLLRERPRSVGDLAEALSIRQPQVSKHLRVLREAGIVEAEPVARRRIYHLRAEPFEQISVWVHTFEQQWEARLNALDTFLHATGEPNRDRRARP